MRQDLQLGYLVLEVSDLDTWAEFAATTLGMAVDGAPSEGVLRVRMDELQQRFLVRRGPADDVVAVGLTALNSHALQDVLDRLAAAGVPVQECDDEEARDRRVKRLHRFTAPGGVTVELASAPYHSRDPLDAHLVPGGFLTGAQGLGHAVFMIDDLPEALAFWTEVLPFRVSDTSGQETPHGVSHAAFLHCNRRHHSIALVQRGARSTYPKKLLHFMVQANSLDAVGMAFDRALDAGLTINRSLGRHPNDRMFSFYATTPSGFDYEFGWGAVEVGEDWAEDHYDHISAWGHRPLTRPSR
ncbi:VOC family protein [Pseudonocardia sp. WMMC193]|uniref:VOC family protein n=1 Tax=Pseudonocardia sp. WMMC193 TaxID=2911965 RepID=UPI001F186D8F|nr:VOC family protein [Pseudonocardia sp. WMMC193]MCF7547922.1 VOC family protein [Pseudonocardia sp. WMMC193]